MEADEAALVIGAEEDGRETEGPVVKEAGGGFKSVPLAE